MENSSIIKGRPNLECAVLPPGINNAAIPLEATVKTISLLTVSLPAIQVYDQKVTS